MALSMTQGPDGLSFETQVVNVTCTNALAKGDVVTFTLASGGFAACTKSATDDFTPDHLNGVALEAVTAGSSGQIGVRGVFDVACEVGADASLSLQVSGANTGRLTNAATDPADNSTAYAKRVGIALADTATAGDLTSVLFDGINGFSAAGN